MTIAMQAILPALTAMLVFIAGWRMCPPQNAMAGGVGAFLLFVLHPAFLSGIRDSSPWDAFFVMFFVCAWLAMEHWSLFMRSWVLAGVFAFGVWVGSSFVFWGIVAMVPWVVFNRRPLAAAGSLLTVFLGGFVIYGVTWGAASFCIRNLGHPIFIQWIRWGTLKMPPGVSLPWCLLALGAVAERFQDMMKNRRADVATFTAMLLVVTALFGSTVLGLAMIALAAPLIMRLLAKREFLFHRGVRIGAGVTFGLSLGLMILFRQDASLATGISIFAVMLVTRRFYDSSRLPWPLAGESACAGAFLAESLASLLR